jgi:hypothetical protein
VSKQEKDGSDSNRQPGGRLVDADAKSLKKVASFDDIGGGDGRAFLSVNDSTAYISNSTNIVRFNIKYMALVSEIEGTASGGGLYAGQTGSMLRAGDRVFAVKQGTGILVIDALTNTLETTDFPLPAGMGAPSST